MYSKSYNKIEIENAMQILITSVSAKLAQNHKHNARPMQLITEWHLTLYKDAFCWAYGSCWV